MNLQKCLFYSKVTGFRLAILLKNKLSHIYFSPILLRFSEQRFLEIPLVCYFYNMKKTQFLCNLLLLLLLLLVVRLLLFLAILLVSLLVASSLLVMLFFYYYYFYYKKPFTFRRFINIIVARGVRKIIIIFM